MRKGDSTEMPTYSVPVDEESLERFLKHVDRKVAQGAVAGATQEQVEDANFFRMIRSAYARCQQCVNERFRNIPMCAFYSEYRKFKDPEGWQRQLNEESEAMDKYRRDAEEKMREHTRDELELNLKRLRFCSRCNRRAWLMIEERAAATGFTGDAMWNYEELIKTLHNRFVAHGADALYP